MNARTGLVLGGLAACLLVVACGRDAASPLAPGDRPRLATESVTCSDSVYAGYGNQCTGGLCYESFEYDPETCTEYVVTSDPDSTKHEPTMTTDTTFVGPPAPR